MISEDPFYTHPDRARAGSVTCVREVPNGTSSSDNELEASNQEGIDPEPAKEVIKEDISSLI